MMDERPPAYDGRGSAREALDRTLRLMRGDLRDGITDDCLLGALTDVRVVLSSDARNAAARDGQTALITAALLASRAGAHVFWDTPNVPLAGVQPPLVGTHLVSAALDAGRDLIPSVHAEAGWPRGHIDIVVILGDSPYRTSSARFATQVIRLVGEGWSGAISGADGEGTRWRDSETPFGALAAGTLAAGEAYKAAMRRLSPYARRGTFEQFFAPVSSAEVVLAPKGTPAPPADLGAIDFVSGGAVTHAVISALARIPRVTADARVIEPEHTELSNLNRYALLRRSRLGWNKASDIAAMELGHLTVTPVASRYEGNGSSSSPLAATVIVGVDHIPTRWAVQRARPAWLGVGATDNYLAVASFHTAGTACVGCLHPIDLPMDRSAPTLAVVSYWAGLRLASILMRRFTGEDPARIPQSAFMTPLRLDLPTSTILDRVRRSPMCPVQCSRLAL